jgi:hypothetical protein
MLEDEVVEVLAPRPAVGLLNGPSPFGALIALIVS